MPRRRRQSPAGLIRLRGYAMKTPQGSERVSDWQGRSIWGEGLQEKQQSGNRESEDGPQDVQRVRRLQRQDRTIPIMLSHGPQISIENAEMQAATRIRTRPATAANRAAHFSRGGESWVVMAVLISFLTTVVI